jgi:DNA modification methylase
LSVWEITKKNPEFGHPTEKPIAVPAHAIAHSSKPGDIVMDLFGGTGPPLMACEAMGRRCRIAEMDPHWCDVMLARWEEKTGDKAVKLV